VTGRVDLGERAARPEVVLGSIWAGVSDGGGNTVIVDPQSLLFAPLGCCSPEQGYFTAGDGSIWQYDAPSGSVVRWDGETHQTAADIPVTGSPFYGGLCLTSIAAGAGAVWVTVGANVNFGCSNTG
jgi:hypothetical protein